MQNSEEERQELLKAVKSDAPSPSPSRDPDCMPGVSNSVLYLVACSLMPVFNKWSMKRLHEESGYPFAVTLLFLQMMGLCTVLAMVEVVRHLRQSHTRAHGETLPSWFLDGNFWYKCKVLSLPASLFCAEIVLNNLGLWYTSVVLHIVLRSAGIVITLLLTSFVKSERPTGMQLLCCSGIIVSSVLSGYMMMSDKRTVQEVSPTTALIINCLSVLLGSCNVLVSRRMVVKLREKPTPGGSGLGMLPVELCLFNMGLSGSGVGVVSLIMERSHWHLISGVADLFVLLVVVGTLMTTGMQLGRIGVLTYARAVTFTVLAGWRDVNQVILAILVFKDHSFTPMFWAMTILFFFSSGTYTWSLASRQTSR